MPTHRSSDTCKLQTERYPYKQRTSRYFNRRRLLLRIQTKAPFVGCLDGWVHIYFSTSTSISTSISFYFSPYPQPQMTQNCRQAETRSVYPRTQTHKLASLDEITRCIREIRMATKIPFNEAHTAWLFLVWDGGGGRSHSKDISRLPILIEIHSIHSAFRVCWPITLVTLLFDHKTDSDQVAIIDWITRFLPPFSTGPKPWIFRTSNVQRQLPERIYSDCISP